MTRRRLGLALAAAGLLLVLLGLAASQWLLHPDNLARLLVGRVARDYGATLILGHDPALRLVPRLQLDLREVRLERDGRLLASVDELRVALPWSALWRGGLTVESLSLRRPVIAWPALRDLLGERDAPTPARSTVPRLPRVAVGLRVEDATLLSGDGDGDWRLDRVSLLTTPIADGEPFHVDAGVRIRGSQSRTVSMTARGRAGDGAEGIDLDDLVMRLVVSPDNLPLDQGIPVDLSGFLRIGRDGVAAADIAGQLHGWPEWLPNPLAFADDRPIALWLRRTAGESVLVATLSQDERSLEARLLAADLAATVARITHPLDALTALRGRWSLDQAQLGAAQLEGITLEVVDTPEATPDAALDDATGAAAAQRPAPAAMASEDDGG